MTLIKIIIAIIVGVPSLVGVMSFVVWENGFKIFGTGYIVRLTIFLVVLVCLMHAIEKDGLPLCT